MTVSRVSTVTGDKKFVQSWLIKRVITSAKEKSIESISTIIINDLTAYRRVLRAVLYFSIILKFYSV